MECVNCECTVKTMNGLESSIRALLQRGKLVNRMMRDEKAISEARRAEEVQELKKQLPKTKSTATTGNTVNSDLSVYRTFTNTAGQQKPPNPSKGNNNVHFNDVDFDVPTLPTEASEISVTPYTSASVSIPVKTPSMASTRIVETTECTTEYTTSTFKKSKGDRKKSNGWEIPHVWFMDNSDGGVEELPMKVYVEQVTVTFFKIRLVFLDKNKEIVMDMSMTMDQGKVGSVEMCGKEAKLVD